MSLTLTPITDRFLNAIFFGNVALEPTEPQQPSLVDTYDFGDDDQHVGVGAPEGSPERTRQEV